LLLLALDQELLLLCCQFPDLLFLYTFPDLSENILFDAFALVEGACMSLVPAFVLLPDLSFEDGLVFPVFPAGRVETPLRWLYKFCPCIPLLTRGP
jgi:hypothetical protein